MDGCEWWSRVNIKNKEDMGKKEVVVAGLKWTLIFYRLEADVTVLRSRSELPSASSACACLNYLFQKKNTKNLVQDEIQALLGKS